MTKHRNKKIFFLCITILAVLCTGLTVLYGYMTAKELASPVPLGKRTAAQEKQLASVLEKNFPERSSIALSGLPYRMTPPSLDINAESAILVDVKTGSVLFEKNADEEIPPASMTKLVEMYVIFQAVEDKEVSLDDEVPLPPQSWSENLPSDASRMFLGKGQHVTLRELMLGLAIASGNDASIAAAHFICGSMEDFVERMNTVVRSMGLTRTHFVESSGYSEENKTTAREFATFARMYLLKYPQSLRQFHSRKLLEYPLEHNLPEDQKHFGNSRAIAQHNTNKLLDIIPGCDGLKTGFINESGYNIALTAEQQGTRFLSITMRGPGHSTAEGNKYRIADGKTLFTYSFAHFADYRVPQSEEHEYTVGVAGAQESYVKLVPAYDESFTVPFIQGNSPVDAANAVQVKVTVPDCLYASVTCGTQYGSISYCLGNTVLRTVPLVADRDIPQSGPAGRLYGKMVYQFVKALKDRQ